MDAFDTFEVGGIAGTQMEDTLSFDVACWLVRRMPGQVEIAWDNYEPGRELGTTGPRFMPLLEDDAYVEADTPFRRWLETAAGLAGRNASRKRKLAIHRTYPHGSLSASRRSLCRSSKEPSYTSPCAYLCAGTWKLSHLPHAQLAPGSQDFLSRWPAHQPQPGFARG